MSEAQRDNGPATTQSDVRTDRYWGSSRSGAHQVSRPIVVDGLREPQVIIELAPRIRFVNGGWVDDSYHAVDSATLQFARHFTLEQLVMATVALRVHMRRSKEFLGRKRALQDEWTALARRMKRQRVEEEHLAFAESSLHERRRELDVRHEPAEALRQLLAAQEEELAERRTLLKSEGESLRVEWRDLESRDAELLAKLPHAEKAQDLKTPFTLTLIQGRPDPRRKVRSLGSAMDVMADALQKPLSRTDQMLLEIALRRCVRAAAPGGENKADHWEREVLRKAEGQFVAEFDWARPYALGDAPATAVNI